MINKKDEIKDVQPLRSLQQIEDMKWALRRHCSERDYVLFLMGINTGLRVGDLLRLKVADVRGKKRVTVREGKTKKPRIIYLTNIYEDIESYVSSLKTSEWLFPSRKGKHPISRIQAYRQLQKASDMAEITEGIGTHTMRKTFGYWHYKQFKDVAELQMILNHTHPKVTLRYIGILEEEVEQNLMAFKL